MIFWDFLRFFGIFGFFDHFWQFLDCWGFLWTFGFFWTFFTFFWDFFWIFFNFMGFFWILGFLEFFEFLLDFFFDFFFCSFKVTKVTTLMTRGWILGCEPEHKGDPKGKAQGIFGWLRLYYFNTVLSFLVWQYWKSRFCTGSWGSIFPYCPVNEAIRARIGQ